MNWRLTIALPLLLAAAPAHASHWEMTCPNVKADLPPDTISSDPERGYLLVSGASGNTLYLVDRISSRDEPIVIQAYRPRGEGLLLLAFDDNKPGLIRFLADGNDYLPKQACSVATHVPTERYSPHDNLPLPSLPDVEYLVDNPQTKAAFDARFGDGSADGILPVVDARLDTPASAKRSHNSLKICDWLAQARRGAPAIGASTVTRSMKIFCATGANLRPGQRSKTGQNSGRDLKPQPMPMEAARGPDLLAVAPQSRWIRPLADYDRRETTEVHGARYG
jgi:hypothetical protein